MTSKNTFGISFFTRKHRGTEKKVPIYARITVDGKRTELSIKMDIDPNHWHKARGSAKGQGDEIKSMNTTLEQIHGRIVECYQEVVLNKLPVTAENVKNRYLGFVKKEYTLMYAIKYHNQEMKGVLENGTLINYYTTERYAELYLKEICKVSDIPLSQLNYSFLVGFDKYIRDRKPEGKRKPCNNNGAVKHIKRMKKIINLAIKNEWLDRDPFKKYKVTILKTIRKHLTEEELIAIENKEFVDKKMQRVKDLFVFSCYTGLAYLESFNLTPQSVIIGIDGEYWLSIRRKKTNEPVKIPLLSKALAIIEKYKDDPSVLSKGKLLPSYANQPLNNALKELAKDCNIEKHLTFHMARHTFATIVTLTNGVPIETVSKLLGHTSIKTTQIYAHVIEKKISDDVQLLRVKLNENALALAQAKLQVV